MLAASGAMAVLVLRKQSPRTLTLIGATALVAGVGLTVLAVTFGSVAGFFVGTAIAGAGFGGGFQGAIRSVIPLAAPHQRAGVLSVVYVVSYLAMGLPAVIAGFVLVHERDLLATAAQYGVAVMVLAVLALLGAARPVRQPARRRSPCRSQGRSQGRHPPKGPDRYPRTGAGRSATWPRGSGNRWSGEEQAADAAAGHVHAGQAQHRQVGHVGQHGRADHAEGESAQQRHRLIQRRALHDDLQRLEMTDPRQVRR